MTASKKTALQIRNLLRITKKYAVIGENEFRNKDAREYLHAMYYDDSIFNIIDNGTHFLIWN
jgi:DNA polymerase/3'-5' exonuclease PolX